MSEELLAEPFLEKPVYLMGKLGRGNSVRLQRCWSKEQHQKAHREINNSVFGPRVIQCTVNNRWDKTDL